MATVDERLAAAEAHFEEEHFAECRVECNAALLLSAAAGDGDGEQQQQVTKRLRMLLRKCDLNAEPTEEERAAAEAARAAAEAERRAAAGPPRVRSEWFQTATHVTFTFYVKNRSADQVQVESDARSLTVTIDCGDGRSFQATYDPLFAEISAAAPKVSVRPPKVEVTVAKVAPVQWAAAELQGDVVAAVSAEAPPASAAAAAAADPAAAAAKLKYPNSKGRDWSSFKADDEEEDKGGDPLNSLFKKIYGDADEDTRRAMMKSFQESNGTVLSTNWKEVGAKHVDGEAPKGMELKHAGQ